VRVSLKSVSGVDSVEVSLAKGLASVKLKPNNTATLKQLSEAIAKNGFTMKQSAATIAGTVLTQEGEWKLRVSGSNDLLDLKAAPQAPTLSNGLNNKSVTVVGMIPEAAKGKVPAEIQYQSITENP